MKFSPVPSAFLEGFASFEHFILLGHEQPDADCLCSMLGLESFLKKQNKKVTLLAQKPFTRPETLSLENRFTAKWEHENDGKSLVVLLDLSDPERTGFSAEKIHQYPLMVIDHHDSGKSVGEYRYVDPGSPSTTLLVLKIWEAAGLEPDRETAEQLFFGFSTDTGFFRHLEESTEEVFLAVSTLIKLGASPNRTYRMMSGGRQLATRRLMGRILERSRLYCDGRILLSWEEQKDREELGTDERDSDKLYQLLQSIEGCEAVALFRMESGNKCIVGLRSNNDIDVGRIASALGGGGHKKAAGGVAEGTMEEVKARVLTLFQEQLLPKR